MDFRALFGRRPSEPQGGGDAQSGRDAVRALMGINGTMGFVIDDTGSMGTEINQVKAQAQNIVLDVAGGEAQPDEFLLERFGDPDFGPPVTTCRRG